MQPSASAAQLRLLSRLAGGLELDQVWLCLHRGFKKQANEVTAKVDVTCCHALVSFQEGVAGAVAIIIAAVQVRPGNVLDFRHRLMQVVKYQHTQGAGRQLGNVQVCGAVSFCAPACPLQ